MVDKKLFKGIYSGRRVLITGHTGFKGSWLALWLDQLGANVIGYSLDPPTSPSHFQLLDIKINSIIGNILDGQKLEKAIRKHNPEIVFHLAAQPIVRESYNSPIETFQTNVIGTANVFEACRLSKSVKAIINVTSDKCYENKEWIWGYRENDPMGGHDPYSASKGCSELVTTSYRNSFFNVSDKENGILLASARAGNVIGGGDWAKDRLIPDIIKAANEGKDVSIRSPNAVRPWQHVLEPLSGYLLLGQNLLEGKKNYAEAWNFGPSEKDNISVGKVVGEMAKNWKKIKYKVKIEKNAPHEAGLLMLDCSKAYNLLGWHGIWETPETITHTTKWYKDYYTNGLINSLNNLNDYVRVAKEKNAIWHP